MKILNTSNEIGKVMCSLLRRYNHYLIASAWASVDSTPFDLLRKNKSKISKMIIGTHFYQTHPDFIKEFRKNINTRFMLKTSGVFHPKIFMFYNSSRNWECLIGSANFTKSAFSINDEINILCSSKDMGAEIFFKDFKRQISDYWISAKKMNKTDLKAYKMVWNQKQKYIKRLRDEYGTSQTKKPLFLSQVFSLDWPQFVKAVKNDDLHSFKNRLQLLKQAHNIFNANFYFSELSKSERRKIAGLDSKETPEGFTWLWFGSMKGAGIFQNKINENNKFISKALNHIPSVGTITKYDYLSYINTIKKAFPKGGVKVSVASRLLTMKRPDIFVCLSSKNKEKLCEDFGISKNIDFERYWDEIILRIQDSVWWNVSRPNNKTEKQIWDGRAAMIDVLYYKE